MSIDNNNNNASNNNAAAELAAATIGCRIKFTWLGATRSLDDGQQQQAADLFSADSEFIKASKKLFDNRRPEFRAVNRVKTSIRQYWQNNTLPFTEPGVRLLKRSAVAEFTMSLETFAAELAAAVVELDGVYSELLDEARRRLGSLYNAGDYPATLRGAFGVAFDFPNLSPPDYLAQLSPELFERERNRMAAQFAESVELAEQSFAAELAAMLERITATLNGESDGKPKIFRDSMVENVAEFFQRFRTLNIASSPELSGIVERAQAALNGITPAALRSSVHVRDMVKASVAALSAELESGLIDRPARRIHVGAMAPPVAEFAAEQPVPNGWRTVETSVDEPATIEPATIEPATVEPVDASPVAEPPADPAAEFSATPATIAEPPAAEPVAEPDTIAFNFNYGGGNVRRVLIPANPQRLTAGVQ